MASYWLPVAAVVWLGNVLAASGLQCYAGSCASDATVESCTATLQKPPDKNGTDLVCVRYAIKDGSTTTVAFVGSTLKNVNDMKASVPEDLER